MVISFFFGWYLLKQVKMTRNSRRNIIQSTFPKANQPPRFCIKKFDDASETKSFQLKNSFMRMLYDIQRYIPLSFWCRSGVFYENDLTKQPSVRNKISIFFFCLRHIIPFCVKIFIEKRVFCISLSYQKYIQREIPFQQKEIF